MISRHDNVNYPFGYRRIKPGTKNKNLLKPIPGIYNVDYTNPLIDTEHLLPILTDENGKVEFTGLAFTTDGPIGMNKTITS